MGNLMTKSKEGICMTVIRAVATMHWGLLLRLRSLGVP